MSDWLFSSRGHPIAFISGDNVFSRRGKFLGRLEEGEVWHGEYVGEIYSGDRLVNNRTRGRVIKGRPGTPGTPGIPGIPGSRGAISLPGGYEDVQTD